MSPPLNAFCLMPAENGPHMAFMTGVLGLRPKRAEESFVSFDTAGVALFRNCPNGGVTQGGGQSGSPAGEGGDGGRGGCDSEIAFDYNGYDCQCTIDPVCRSSGLDGGDGPLGGDGLGGSGGADADGTFRSLAAGGWSAATTYVGLASDNPGQMDRTVLCPFPG